MIGVILSITIPLGIAFIAAGFKMGWSLGKLTSCVDELSRRVTNVETKVDRVHNLNNGSTDSTKHRNRV
jgi:hypothetical protein